MTTRIFFPLFQDLFQVLDGDLKVPSSTGVLLGIQGELSHDDISLDQIVTCINRDPALALQVLKMANSALFGNRQYTTIQQAVFALGRDRVLMACQATVLEQLKDSCQAGSMKGLILQVWEHSQTVAGYAQELAESAGVNPQEAHLAGLLHDVGEMYIYWRMGQLGMSPAQFDGQYVSDMWHIPIGLQILECAHVASAIREAVTEHHQAGSARTGLSRVLREADKKAWHEEFFPIEPQKAGTPSMIEQDHTEALQ